MTDLNRIRELSGFSRQDSTIKALKESKRIIVDAHDLAISQAENGYQLDEGFFNSLRAALATAGTVAAGATKSIVKTASKLTDGVKAIYQDHKAQAELKDLLKGLGTLAKDFEALEAKAPTIIKKDERVREIVKVFADAMQVAVNELSARALPPEKVDPTMSEAVAINEIEKFLKG